MRVLHCCLAAFYIDDFSYQENILPRIHAELGHDTRILASTETYLEQVRLGYTNSGSYRNADGLKVTRLPYVRWLPAKLARKLRIYKGVGAVLREFRPDIIFLHDCQFLSIVTVARHARRFGATVYVDCHTDFINSGRNFVSRHVLHGLIYRFCAATIAPVTRRFYATLPLRAEFLRDVYKIPPQQIALLPFGVDDSRIDAARRGEVRASMRADLGIAADELAFIAGGKIDRRKAIHTLLDAFTRLADAGKLPNTRLILFGKAEPALRAAVQAAAQHRSVVYVDWIAAAQLHRYLWAADVAVFPGTHSVLWEEAVGLGLPCVFRRWHGIEHIDLGGNCIMLDEVDESCLSQVLLDIAGDRQRLERMREAASRLGPKHFSYTSIARMAIADACARPARDTPAAQSE